jgi:hypothetical protein
MKDMPRAIRRHHAARLKKARRFYYGRDLRALPRELGMVLHTPQACSCWMCGHRRQHEGPKLAELLHIVKLAEEV